MGLLEGDHFPCRRKRKLHVYHNMHAGINRKTKNNKSLVFKFFGMRF